ncbi:MAG: DRTGG domain-containing protein [Synergistaceae bacterium]|nr:DRTGG domain-containing protein [Synergistaceae bacterium]
MTLRDITELIGATVLTGSDEALDKTVNNAYACDLMSDVLAFCSPGALLLTGLTNVQIVRTAQMLDLPAIVFVRGKVPLEETTELAKANNIPIILAKKSLYEICGILYAAGLKPCYIPDKEA